MITVRVRDREASALPRWPITSGSIGLPVSFDFDDAWGGLAKTAVFRGSGETVDVALLTDACVVPPEVLGAAGGDLFIGVYGANSAGTVVIPTIWTNAGYIYEGAEPSGVDPAEPTPSWVAQVQAAAAEALEKANEAMTLTRPVFWATYGETTNAEIEAAYQAGKICLVKARYSDVEHIYQLTYRMGASGHRFTAVDGNYSYWVNCNGNSWNSYRTSI